MDCGTSIAAERPRSDSRRHASAISVSVSVTPVSVTPVSVTPVSVSARSVTPISASFPPLAPGPEAGPSLRDGRWGPLQTRIPIVELLSWQRLYQESTSACDANTLFASRARRLRRCPHSGVRRIRDSVRHTGGRDTRFGMMSLRHTGDTRFDMILKQSRRCRGSGKGAAPASRYLFMVPSGARQRLSVDVA